MKLPSGQDCSVSKPCLLFRRYVSHPNLTANGVPSTPTAATSTPTSAQATMQTWPFVEIYSHKKYFYLEAQSYTIDGHAELFLWLWFLGESQMTLSFFIFEVFPVSIFFINQGSESEELHYRYHLTVIHGKSEYSYRGPVSSMTKGANDIRWTENAINIQMIEFSFMMIHHLNNHTFLQERRAMSGDQRESLGLHELQA